LITRVCVESATMLMAQSLASMISRRQRLPVLAATVAGLKAPKTKVCVDCQTEVSGFSLSHQVQNSGDQRFSLWFVGLPEIDTKTLLGK
jgi:hypothetical protein